MKAWLGGISEGSKDSTRVTRVIFWIRTLVADQPRLKKQLDYQETNPAEVKALCSTGTTDAGHLGLKSQL